MREILQSCIRIDELANTAYREMAERCEDSGTSRLIAQMAIEESAHVGWWSELLEAWDAGLLPDIWPDSDDVLATVSGIILELEHVVPVKDGALSPEEVLTAATRLEFFTLDPLFAELIDLTEPAIARMRHESYSRHVERLIAAIQERFPAGSVAGFLASVLLRTQRENRVLARHAARDPLTGLANRRALNAQMLQWTAWAARYGHPLALLFADVDEFKSINDRFGHSVGDRILRLIADRIQSVLRESDLAARLGGDEFAVLAPEIDLEGARGLGLRLVEAVREIRAVGGDGEEIAPTISVGSVVVIDPRDSEARTVDSLLAAADRSLYAAKHSGRNRAADPFVLARTPETPDPSSGGSEPD